MIKDFLRTLSILFMALLLMPNLACAQQEPQAESELIFAEDEEVSVVVLKKEHKPRTATLLSTFVPGAGQVYNRQWYKLPIIYGLGATCVYFYQSNKKEWDTYQDEYIFRMNHGDSTFNSSLSIYPTTSIQSLRDYYRRNTELTIILSAALYALNIIDATVFAHLYTFDVSNNLSMEIKPYAVPTFDLTSPVPMNAGLSLTFTFK